MGSHTSTMSLLRKIDKKEQQSIFDFLILHYKNDVQITFLKTNIIQCYRNILQNNIVIISIKVNWIPPSD